MEKSHAIIKKNKKKLDAREEKEEILLIKGDFYARMAENSKRMKEEKE